MKNKSTRFFRYLFQEKLVIMLGVMVCLGIFIQVTCTAIPPENPTPLASDSSVLLSEFISRKWLGTNIVPSDTPVQFIDNDRERSSCFSFDDTTVSNQVSYEWKSGVYSNNNNPKQAWFVTTTNTEGQLILDDEGYPYYTFYLRYNVMDAHLLSQYHKSQTNNDGRVKYLSVREVLKTVLEYTTDNVVKDESLTNRSIYMPILVRNFQTKQDGSASIELNYAIRFIGKQISEAPDWSQIHNDLKVYSESATEGLIKNYWTTYYEVDDIENGMHGCYNTNS